MTKQTPFSGPILSDLLLNPKFMETETGKKLLNEHMLLGWLANKPECQGSNLYEDAKRESKRQWHLNHTYQKVLQEIAPKLEEAKISPIILKGLSLVEDFYSDIGCRSMSDIDLLVKPTELSSVLEILEGADFQVISDKKWKANQHKVELNRFMEGVEVVIELHTKLFYHCDDPEWKTGAYSTAPFLKLSGEHNLLYLSTHLGFQHSFLKMFWFIAL